MIRSKQRRFLSLYEPIHDRFERFCRARVYGEMEYTDLMNETLLLAYSKFETLKSKEAFLSFLFSISVRILANDHRKMKPERISTMEEVHTISGTESSETDLEINLLHQALSQLGNDQRECLILFEISGFSIREIAEIQEVSESAVKQRLKRGRDQLTRILTFESAYKTGEEIN